VVVLCLLIEAGTAAGGAEDTLLEPEQAFRFSARLLADDTVEVNYRIADGYYLYKDRFSFKVEPEAVKLDSLEFPAAQWHEDEFFGRSEIYRREVTIRLHLPSPPSGRAVDLLAVSQGCADIGVCYLPTTHRARLKAGSRRPAGRARQ